MTTIVDEVRKVKKQSEQRRLIEAALLKYGKVNVSDAWNGIYGAPIRRLGARIHELRTDPEAPWLIRTDERPDGECIYHLMRAPADQLAML